MASKGELKSRAAELGRSLQVEVHTTGKSHAQLVDYVKQLEELQKERSAVSGSAPSSPPREPAPASAPTAEPPPVDPGLLREPGPPDGAGRYAGGPPPAPRAEPAPPSRYVVAVAVTSPRGVLPVGSRVKMRPPDFSAETLKQLVARGIVSDRGPDGDPGPSSK